MCIFIQLQIIGCNYERKNMKKILMSFWPSVYDRIIAQTKIIEFRRRYTNEDTLVYMYITTPCMAVKGIIELGKRIDMSKVPMDTLFYSRSLHDGYKPNHYLYGMPIHSIQETTSLMLAEIKAQIPQFIAPQSYYILDKNPELLQLIESHVKPIADRRYNSISLPNN